MTLQKTSIADRPLELNTRPDFNRPDFDRLIHEKGRNVLIETALLCPCKSKNANQQSNCKNCGGSGWVYINPRETRVVVTSIDAASKIQGWSEELRGMANVSANYNEELSFMDKITLIDAESLHAEVLFVKSRNTTKFAYSAYPVKKIRYIAKFVGTAEKLVRLVEGTDYTLSGNAFIFLTVPVDTSVTIRYYHAPTYHIVEMKRDTMQSFRMTEQGEKNQLLPLSAYMKRAHYLLNAENLNGDRLLDNSYLDDNCTPNCEC